MNKKSVSTKLSILLAFSFVTIMACQKNDITKSSSPPVDNQLNTQFMNTTNLAYQGGNLDRQDFEDMMDAGYMGENAGNLQAAASDCRTVTCSPSCDVYPHTKTIVYDNCTKCDGSILNGTKIITYYVDPAVAQPGDLLSVTEYDGFSVDSFMVTGKKSFYLVSNTPYVLHIVADKQLIAPGRYGGKKSFTSDRMWTQTVGGNTADQSDDVFSIVGTSSGKEILHGGDIAEFTAVIDSNDPLVNSNDCCWITSGTETVTIHEKYHGSESTLTEVLDYGDGTCDNMATLTINGGDAQTVELPLRFFPLDSNE